MDDSELTTKARALIESATSITTFSGAGLSAESGIATFRDPETNGLWSQYDPLQLASTEGFAADPNTVSDWYNWRRTTLSAANPNPAHQCLARLSNSIHITQNVDDLLLRAGCNPQQMIQLHGRIDQDRCNNSLCDYVEAIDLANPPSLRPCPKCQDLLRPAVVWFGEALDGDAWQRAEQAVSEADLLLVIGTSATVYPAASLIPLARATGGRILVINSQPSAASHSCDLELIGPCGHWLPRLFD